MGCQIAERETFSRFCMEAPDDFRKQAEDILIRYVLTQNTEQDIVVDGGEEFLRVAFEYPDGPGIIMGHLPEKFLKSIKRLVNPLSVPTGIRIGDEQSIEERVQDTIHGLVDHPVTNARLVDMSRFRVGDMKGLVAGVVIYSRFQISMQDCYIIREPILEYLHVFSVPLATKKFPPCHKQILFRNDIIICMSQLSFHMPSKNPFAVNQPKLIPVVLKLKDAYGLWQGYFQHIPKANRFTLGSKIDAVFLDTIEYCFLASYTRMPEKIAFIDRALSRTDLLKLPLQLAWEIKIIDGRKYADLGGSLSEVGRMLGGWKRSLTQKTPPEKEEKREK